MSNPADQVNALIECASVNEEITGWDDERMKDVDKLTEKILNDLHELTGVEVKNESTEEEDIQFSKSPKVLTPQEYARFKAQIKSRAYLDDKYS